MEEIPIGTRKLQKGAGAHVLNVPVVAVRALDLHTGDDMRWSITTDGALRIEKEHNPEVDVDMLGGMTPTPGTQHTSQEVAVDV